MYASLSKQLESRTVLEGHVKHSDLASGVSMRIIFEIEGQIWWLHSSQDPENSGGRKSCDLQVFVEELEVKHSQDQWSYIASHFTPVLMQSCNLEK